MTPRLIPTYLTWKVPVPKTIAEDLESKHKGAGKLQRVLDACAAVDLLVQEAKQEEES